VDADGPDNNPLTCQDNDYHVAADSPCADAGKNEDWMWSEVDLDGSPRIVNGTVDMGAYECVLLFKIVQVMITADGRIQLKWNSRPAVSYTIWSCIDPLAGQWTEEPTIPSAGESTAWADPDAGSTCKFHRIELK